jgi:hypothetical protein
MDANKFWHQQQLNKVEAEVFGNKNRLKGARTLAEVVRLGDIHLPPELRALRNTLPELKSLKRAIETRLEEMVANELKLIASKDTAEEAKKQRGQLMSHWEVLRGDYSQIYRHALDESARILYKKEQEAKAAAPRPDEPSPP